MRVFKMNDCDWVCAKSEEQAKEFYHKETGIDMVEINEDFKNEVSLEDTMLVEINDLQEEDLEESQTLRRWYGSIWVVKPFYWVIEQRKITKPSIICSTEL